ncbi:DUF7946 domain-containing protein [Sphingobium chungangianum]
MEVPPILISYDGGDALHHKIDAKLLGQSLQGIDRLVSDCTVIFSLQRLPKRGERAPLVLKVKEPKAGSYQLPALSQEVSELLAIGIPILQAVGPEIIAHYVQAVLDYFKGEDQAVEIAIQKMADMHAAGLAALTASQRDALAVIDAVDARRHEEAMGMQELLKRSIAGSGSAAVDYVAPVGRGRSVDTASFRAGRGEARVIDIEGADAIRESQKMEWRPIGNAVLKTDGFKYHSSVLSIENPDRDGFMMAEVMDPAFEADQNAYTAAAQKRSRIEVVARKGYKNGILAKIQILEFVREID